MVGIEISIPTDSVNAFPEGDAFVTILEKCGYKSVSQKALTLGVATIYTGVKWEKDNIRACFSFL